MKFKEILDVFRKDEAEEVVIALTDDVHLRNGFLAWGSVSVHQKDPGVECDVTEPTEQWEWLWERVEFDVNNFTVISGVKNHEVYALLTRLKGLKLIYPDGTRNTNAEEYIRAVIDQKVKNASKSRKSV